MGPGDVIDGRFVIEETAGKGGMGTVYRCRDERSGTFVAVKTLFGTQTAEDVRRFSKEAEWLAELHHPGVVRYLTSGRTASGEPYIVMEWLEGESLNRRLARAPLSPIEAIHMIELAARALGLAHTQGIIHRDIKPSNLILRMGNPREPVVLDFGVARRVSSETSLTKSGAAVGTWAYMSPEQAQGARDLDARTDVFSLGCVLFECLTGRRAFPGDQIGALLAKIILEDPPSLRHLRPELPARLDELVARMLAKDPALRPPNGSAVADELALLRLSKDASERISNLSYAPALTAVERRVGWALLTGRIPDLTTKAGETGETLDLIRRGGRARLQKLHAIVVAHHGRMSLRDDGSLLVGFAGAGVPVDQGVRAARCALALKALIPSLPMALHTGLNVREDPTLESEVLDVESASASSPEVQRGAIRLDRIAARLLKNRFEIREDDAGPYLFSEPDPLAFLVSVLHRPTLCVGRERELNTLESILDECIHDSVAHAVLVTGAAGVGKTRLQYELLRRINAREEQLAVFLGFGDPLLTSSRFGLLVGLVRRAAGIDAGDPVEVRQRALKDRLRMSLAGEPERLARIYDTLSVTLSRSASDTQTAPGCEPANATHELRDAIVDWWSAECAVHPVVVVLENLHWSDLATVQLLDYVLGRMKSQRLFVVALARPNVMDVFPRLWSSRGLTHLSLGPLSRRASQELVRHILEEDAGDELVEPIVERGEGNPFYLEELVRVVAEGGDPSALPNTVVAMIQSRLDSLDVDGRRVLRAASVFGERFWAGGVAALIGPATSKVRLGEALSELERREFIASVPRSTYAGEVEYVFRQPLLRGAAYALLTEDDRVLGHRLAGEWLLSQGEPDWHIVGHHLQRGGFTIEAVGEH